MEDKMQFAVLIDAENVSAKYVSVIFDELEKYGFASCRRIYGNWSKGSGWKEELLLEYSIIPIQQFSYTAGKNSTDMAMVIDAMDLLYQDKVDGFCLVTSDSDFTRLAMRLREEKKYVLGMGESKTPLALNRACNKFIHLNLIGETAKEPVSHAAAPSQEESLENVTSIDNLESAIWAMYNETGEDELDLAFVGKRLNEKFPDFDVRNYGYSKLKVFLSEEFPHFAVGRDNNRYLLKKGNLIDRAVLDKEVLAIIKKNKGMVENLSNVTAELKKKYSGFDTKDYGYSRISGFLRSVEGVTVSGNTVKLKSQKSTARKKSKKENV
jgi:uncharacterized protein (TIGR00288 family)